MKIITHLDTQHEAIHSTHEWLVTNGIGGYAFGSISGTPARKYHSLLNAALPAPYGRTIMLNYVKESLILPDQDETALSSVKQIEQEKSPSLIPKQFYIENGIPIWRYETKDFLLEKSLFLVHHQNTLHMSYKLLSGSENVFLKWCPFFHFRKNEEPVNTIIPDEAYTIHATDQKYEIECPKFPRLRIFCDAPLALTLVTQQIENIFYEKEAQRGYESVGCLKSPGFFLASLPLNKRITFIVSTESWETISALSPNEAWYAERLRKKNLLGMSRGYSKTPLFARLVLAADQFIISPQVRFKDMVRLQASGEDVKTIIAGYPWFTDWGRDTMISLEGLTLLTGRFKEAHSILHTFAYYLRDGLIPNMFPDGETHGIYNTADATLWFFHAIDRYIATTEDDEILEFLLPKLYEIIKQHMKGTKFGIRMDEDCLLIQGEESYQLTWMDAKVDDWVVTPRRGKAVEINALWYNALKLFEKWSGKSLDISEKCYQSFNEKFWNAKVGYLYDVIEGEKGNDSALRPNQLFSISLHFPVLDPLRWKSILDISTQELLTPYGLRTLAPSHPDFKSTYDGDLRSRDAAYHQGTVWPWLIGVYVDVWLKVYPNDLQPLQEILKSLENSLDTSCIGSIGEIFDARTPYSPRGCIAQAWSIAEVIRSYLKIYNSSLKF